MKTNNPVFKVSYINNPEEKEDVHKWEDFFSAPKDQCDNFGYCGVFSDCNSFNAGENECNCLPGFEPKSPRDWNLRDASQGCVTKRKGGMCGNGEKFVKLREVKLPDTTNTRLDMNLDVKACADLCLRNCSCMDYSSANVSEGSFSGCLTWYNELVDLREYPSGGQDFYIRLDAIEFGMLSYIYCLLVTMCLV
ncbi:Apple domain-containing protein [Heracleum sosnowskyi]|uniref:Apple domain-containing protein n=1 Tax=Heracleum sosnowskyi TaxID=360622 RepID=A0AAD8HF18_9APIA|nr:Apple domain-containing protein [Heracleum sosnowskyi]